MPSWRQPRGISGAGLVKRDCAQKGVVGCLRQDTAPGVTQWEQGSMGITAPEHQWQSGKGGVWEVHCCGRGLYRTHAHAGRRWLPQI